MALSPMMQQYLQVKEKNKDSILFFRLGDFYEMFFDDALVASKVLDITLTGRDCGLEERAPMCGVPFHSVDPYIDKLIANGYRVAICEQMEDPAVAKGIVMRDVVRVITAGTTTSSGLLEDKSNNYLCSIYANSNSFGMAYVDITTGELYATDFSGDAAEYTVISELSRYSPSEVVVSPEYEKHTNMLKSRFNAGIARVDSSIYTASLAVEKVIKQFGKCDIEGEALLAVSALLEYLEKTQMRALPHIQTINYYKTGQYMDIDYSTRRNLELTASMRDGKKRGSLLWVLDKTNTAMGGRLLKKWVDKPLITCGQIVKRLNAVQELVNKTVLRGDLTQELSSIQDIERLVSKTVTGSANPRDLYSLANSLSRLPYILNIIKDCKSIMISENVLNFDLLSDITDYITRAIKENPPFSVREGEIIKDGFNEDVDYHRKAIHEGAEWIGGIEKEEREATGIKNLKVGFNRVMGYYIEISKSNMKDIPDRYVRKQTLANCERYITGKLKEIENVVLGAQERNCQLEYQLFCEVCAAVSENSTRILYVARILAELDALCSLAEVAVHGSYNMPHITSGTSIRITNGRHPVVESMLRDTLFIPNDTFLDDKSRVAVITGPNMAGKSTYMRQTALIVLMAQIGSFVPAESAEIGIVDKIFTRVGASDDLTSGQSTFMVEMTEVANILDNATKHSLLILDEIGRGTSTYDGLSIAWAVVEHIANKKKLGAKTLFATHYHELTELEDKIEGVINYRIAVKKRGDEIIFLRKIVRGGADESYGIEVALLAGVKNEVIKRAKEIAKRLERCDINKTDLMGMEDLEAKETKDEAQFEMFNGNGIIDQLKSLDATTITPIEALNILYALKKDADML